MTAALLAGALAGYGIAVPVGAIAALIVGLTARTSIRVGSAAALGVATADGIYALIAVLGGASLAGVIRPLTGLLRPVAAAVLIAIAVHTAATALRRRSAAGAPTTAGASAAAGASAVPSADEPADRLAKPRGAYLGLLGLTLLNPMTIVYFGALVIAGQTGTTPSATHRMAFVTGAFAASASWQLLVATGGSLLGRILTGPTGRLATALISSAVIVALGASLLVD